MSLTSNRIYQFGEFELRVSARLLARRGTPVPLGSKAFEVLTCLVVHAGEVVTKDELLKTVWPKSFVEEGNLSQHIHALRKLLGDRSAYIVTVPGRGYQFTAPVRQLPDAPPVPPLESGSFLLQRTRERTRIVIEETSLLPGAAPSNQTQTAPPLPAEPLIRPAPDGQPGRGPTPSALQLAVDPGVATDDSRQLAQSPPATLLPSPPGTRRGRSQFWTITLLSLVAVATTFFVWRRFAHPPLKSRKIVLADFENRTGDTGLDDVLRKALEIDLDQSPYIDLMSEPEALNTLRLMGRPPDTPLPPAVAREMCVRSNRQVLVAGSIASVGSKFLLTLEATDCNSGKLLAGARAEAAGKDQTLAALDSASATLRHGLGESAESLEHFQVPIAQATTSSLEALRQYSMGEFLLGRTGKEESEVLPFFQRAVELDPQFAMAQAAIATGYQSLGEYQLALPYYQKAFDLSSHVSEKERLYIRAHYYADDRQDVMQGLEAYRMWAEVYPRDWGPWLDMATEYTNLGQFGAAVAAGEHALSLDSSRGIIYSVLALDYMHVGRYGDAESTALRALSIGRDSTQLDATLFKIALLQQDHAAMARQVAEIQGKPGQWNLLDLQALASAKEGKYQNAEKLFRAAYAAAMSENLPEKADDILIDEASAEVDGGMTSAARATLLRVSQRHPENPEALFLHAELDGTAPPEGALADREHLTASNTLLTYVDGPRIRAEIALKQARPQQAIAELEPAADYDFAAGFEVIAERAEAFLMAKQPEKAAVEYKRILDHPGVDPVSPLFPLAWLGLAQADRQAGRVERSRVDYEQLFQLWSAADPDLPVLVDARRQYASLRMPPR
jgi:DNA-binding winged helix-turn-helix (wHTH) protein/tetratricopeptide (TPR) repeat protein